MDSKQVSAGYYQWLLGFVSPEKFARSGYGKILRQLYSIDFEYSILNDRNRISDGLQLRKLYLNELGLTSEDVDLNRPCSVLEILVSLSRRLANDILGDLDNTGLSGAWFWKMIDNLGLNKYSGGRYDKNECFYIINNWMERDFEFNGKGSPFPLKHPKMDQRKIELGLQMMNYVNENPEISG